MSKFKYPDHAEELPSELLEDAKFVPLNNDVPQFGPPVSKYTMMKMHVQVVDNVTCDIHLWKQP